jgi:hypothetical protein
VKRADIDDERRGGVSTDEHDELVRLRLELRVAKMEVEISGELPPISPRTMLSQNDLHLHLPGLLRSSRGGLLSGDEGVHLGLLCLAGRPRE